MLEKLGHYLFKLLIFGMLCTLLTSFAIWGVGDVFHSNFDDTTAKVGDAKISGREVSQFANQQMNQMQAMIGDAASAPAIRKAMEARVRDRLINDRALAQEANNLGLRLPASTIAQEIGNNKVFYANNAFSPEMFKQYLRRIGMTERQYTTMLAENKTTEYLLSTLSDESIISPAYIQALTEQAAQQRIVSLLTIPREAVKLEKDPTDAELLDFYEKNKSQFAAPELRSFSYLVLDAALVKDTATVTDADISDYYEKHKDNYEKPLADVKEDIRKELSSDKSADALYNAVTAMEDALSGGASLEEVAKQYKRDAQKISAISRTGVGQSGQQESENIPLREQVLKEIFGLESPQQSSTISASQDERYIVVQLDEILPARERALDEVRGMVLRGWKEQAARTALEDRAKTIADKIKNASPANSGNTPLDILAREGAALGQTPRSVGPFFSVGPERETLPQPLLEDIFSAAKGAGTSAYPQGENAYVVAVVQDVLPAKLNDPVHGENRVRAELQKQLREERVDYYINYLRGKQGVKLYALPSDRNSTTQ